MGVNHIGGTKLCPQCVENGLKSVVAHGSCISTAMASPTFYDESGRRHRHDPNRHTTLYSCSNGHRWAETVQFPCWCQPPVEPKIELQPSFQPQQSHYQSIDGFVQEPSAT